LDTVPEGCELASAVHLLTINLGRPFPWGQTSEPAKTAKLWHENRMGYGGLIHEKWFITKDGRFGGAKNVPETLPGSLRSCLLYDGGLSQQPDQLEKNEGFAVITDVPPENRDLYRMIQLHAAEHVVADGGSIIVSPLDLQTNTAYVGFVGRCLSCPNAELISFRQLQKAVPNYCLKLLNEWENWTLSLTKKISPLLPT
jgi:Fe-S cluster biogenesis protein NfuA